ncbi:hypothetical protein P7K49_027808 [Saguinus oedipus]|uniref:Uncharacterized protein n=1 Tax=Saguinus oedipus TaxID=9490 RepID=A0ABQ9UAM2_SAGOE|nr:hypothetical protein P7K49_027808 [Saguinus oedipus]
MKLRLLSNTARCLQNPSGVKGQCLPRESLHRKPAAPPQPTTTLHRARFPVTRRHPGRASASCAPTCQAPDARPGDRRCPAHRNPLGHIPARAPAGPENRPIQSLFQDEATAAETHHLTDARKAGPGLSRHLLTGRPPGGCSTGKKLLGTVTSCLGLASHWKQEVAQVLRLFPRLWDSGVYI